MRITAQQLRQILPNARHVADVLFQLDRATVAGSIACADR